MTCWRAGKHFSKLPGHAEILFFLYFCDKKLQGSLALMRTQSCLGSFHKLLFIRASANTNLPELQLAAWVGKTVIPGELAKLDSCAIPNFLILSGGSLSKSGLTFSRISWNHSDVTWCLGDSHSCELGDGGLEANPWVPGTWQELRIHPCERPMCRVSPWRHHCPPLCSGSLRLAGSLLRVTNQALSCTSFLRPYRPHCLLAPPSHPPDASPQLHPFAVS